MSFELFLFLFLLQVKHYLADFPLQSEYMLGKFNITGWKVPLSWHSLYHGIGTFLVCIMFTTASLAFMLALLDASLHFVIDRTKAIYNIRSCATYTDKEYWNAVGLDQFAHQLSMLLIAIMVF